MEEIERKFIMEKVKNLSSLKSRTYERYFLFNKNGIEIRITRKGNKCILERKEKISDLTRKTVKIEITDWEFDEIKLSCGKKILRKSYFIDKFTSIKVYEGDFKGLIRFEKEFGSEEEAQMFSPDFYDAFGKLGTEITDTKLGKDSLLINLDEDEFKSLLEYYLN